MSTMRTLDAQISKGLQAFPEKNLLRLHRRLVGGLPTMSCAFGWSETRTKVAVVGCLIGTSFTQAEYERITFSDYGKGWMGSTGQQIEEVANAVFPKWLHQLAGHDGENCWHDKAIQITLNGKATDRLTRLVEKELVRRDQGAK